MPTGDFRCSICGNYHCKGHDPYFWPPYNFLSANQFTNIGWKCPNCLTIHNPNTLTCNCLTSTPEEPKKDNPLLD